MRRYGLGPVALRVFDRLELLQILESAARDTVRYLLTAEHGQDERQAEALAQLTEAVLAALRRRLEN
jgi:hypothetical protein